jgi:hypothetical protein
LKTVFDIKNKVGSSKNRSISKLSVELGYIELNPDIPVSYFKLLLCLNCLMEYYFEQPSFEPPSKEAISFLSYIHGALHDGHLIANTMAELNRCLIGGKEFVPWQADTYLTFISKFVNASVVRHRYANMLPQSEKEAFLRLVLNMIFHFLDLYPFTVKRKSADLVKVLRGHSLLGDHVKILNLPRDSVLSRQVDIISKSSMI